MFLVDALLILAMLFFLFLPISDRRTVRMRLCMLCALLAMFSVSITRTPVAPVLLASIASPPEWCACRICTSATRPRDSHRARHRICDCSMGKETGKETSDGSGEAARHRQRPREALNSPSALWRRPRPNW
ncbi:hypothetical protein ACQ86E_16440 [Bradyrhizobium betae]|uniref:hypothetical protein n=1 Tax=Bradyrhizobium betae TaxID=244734 RepID=UPI003D670EF6